MKLSLKVAVFAILISFAAAGAARADTTYNYAGNSFTTCYVSPNLTEPSCTGYSLTGDFVVGTPLAAGTTTNLLTGTNLLSYSFTDGNMSGTEVGYGFVSNLTSYHEGPGGFFDLIHVFSVTTDASDNIIAWDISGFGYATTGQDGFGTSSSDGDGFSWAGVSQLDIYRESNTGDPGTWTDPPAVPEPATWLLLAAALGTLALLGHRRPAAQARLVRL